MLLGDIVLNDYPNNPLDVYKTGLNEFKACMNAHVCASMITCEHMCTCVYAHVHTYRDMHRHIHLKTTYSCSISINCIYPYSIEQS